MIVLKDVTLEYRKLLGRRIRAVSDFSLTLDRGEIHGLIGANGSGKTSLVRSVCGTLIPVTGSVRVLGEDPGRHSARVTRRLGVLLDGTRYIPPRWTGVEAILYHAALYGMKDKVALDRAEELLVPFQMGEAIDRPVVRYSRGMRQKLVIALTLLHDPDVLILDEPTLGLDAQGLSQFQDLLINFKQQGKIIFITSHEFQLLERICDQVTVLDSGKVLFRGTPTDVMHMAMKGFQVTFQTASLPAGSAEQLAAFADIDGHNVTCSLDVNQLAMVLKVLADMEVSLTNVTSNCTLEHALRRLGDNNARLWTAP